MTLLTISVTALIVFGIIAVVSAVNASRTRNRRIETVKQRSRTRELTEIPVSSFGIIREESIPYDTSVQGMEVADLTEKQAHMIRMIFEDVRPDITIKNRKEDYWATTEPAGLN